jgi:hypothetical protein
MLGEEVVNGVDLPDLDDNDDGMMVAHGDQGEEEDENSAAQGEDEDAEGEEDDDVGETMEVD